MGNIMACIYILKHNLKIVAFYDEKIHAINELSKCNREQKNILSKDTYYVEEYLTNTNIMNSEIRFCNKRRKFIQIKTLNINTAEMSPKNDGVEKSNDNMEIFIPSNLLESENTDATHTCLMEINLNKDVLTTTSEQDDWTITRQNLDPTGGQNIEPDIEQSGAENVDDMGNVENEMHKLLQKKKILEENKKKNKIAQNLLKAKLEKMNELKNIFEADMKIYKTLQNNTMETKIPELFTKKYQIFKILDEKNLLNDPKGFQIFVENLSDTPHHDTYRELFEAPEHSNKDLIEDTDLSSVDSSLSQEVEIFSKNIQKQAQSYDFEYYTQQNATEEKVIEETVSNTNMHNMHNMHNMIEQISQELDQIMVDDDEDKLVEIEEKVSNNDVT